MNIRTLLLALPTLYLLVALLFMNGPRSPVLPRLQMVPTRYLFYTEDEHSHSNPVSTIKLPAGVIKPAPRKAQAVPVEEPPATDAEPLHVVKDSDIPPQPENKKLDTIKYYDGNSVQTYPFATAGTGTETWWANIDRGWERDSLHAIKAMLLKRPGATYIDFGSWIGPTVLFATPYAAKVYALEPDPTAYQNVYWNVKANPHIAAKVTVMNLCISNETGTLTMSGIPGDSMSQIGIVEHDNNKKKSDKYKKWSIRCTTLDQFVKDNKIDPNKLVLKVDTEGAEKNILLQLRPWIAQYKPSMLLSFHAFTYPDDRESHKLLKEIVVSYKTAMFPKGEILDKNGFSVGGWCKLCALLLSDDDIKPEDVKEKK